jgi:hypothetical protein
MEQLQSHICLTSYMGNICAFPHIVGSPSSYLTLQLYSILNFLIYEDFFIFFISVSNAVK